MKILMVSYYFPPFNAVGAIRTGKLAKYLRQNGHEIKVLTVNNQPWAANLPVEIDESSIHRTDWLDINKPIQFLLGGKKTINAKGFERTGRIPHFIKKLAYYYKDFFNYPDSQIGWYFYALKEGKSILKNWKPDFILASLSPITSFLIARKLSKLHKIPWVADFRDLWTDNHNAELYQSFLRRKIDKKVEKAIVSDAAALVTVSEPLADILRSKFDKPIAVIKNGYDLEDYPLPDEGVHQSYLRIVYTGIIHPIKRDPAPLFKAILLLGEDAKRIRIDFYGRNNEIIKMAAAEYGLNDIVSCYETIPYHDSLKQQVNADLLLLLTYQAEKEKGVITTKFFEYLGARRPILLLGCTVGSAADMIRERKVGFANNDPIAISNYLKKCLYDKENKQNLPLPLNAISGFSRREQALELVQFLQQILKKDKLNIKYEQNKCVELPE